MKQLTIGLLLFALSGCGGVKHLKAQHERDMRYLERQNACMVMCIKGEVSPEEMAFMIKGWRTVWLIESEMKTKKQ